MPPPSPRGRRQECEDVPRRSFGRPPEMGGERAPGIAVGRRRAIEGHDQFAARPAPRTGRPATAVAVSQYRGKSSVRPEAERGILAIHEGQRDRPLRAASQSVSRIAAYRSPVGSSGSASPTRKRRTQRQSLVAERDLRAARRRHEMAGIDDCAGTAGTTAAVEQPQLVAIRTEDQNMARTGIVDQHPAVVIFEEALERRRRQGCMAPRGRDARRSGSAQFGARKASHAAHPGPAPSPCRTRPRSASR